MFYVNDTGEVREAIKHTGERSTKEIWEKFNLKPVYLGLYYCCGKDGCVKYEAADHFEKRWKPIREDRVRLAEKIFRLALLELEKKQHKDDDWTKEDWLTLRKWAIEEFNELGRELYKFEDNESDKSGENLKMEAAHLAIVAGMLAEKADSEELDEMWDKKAGNE